MGMYLGNAVSTKDHPNENQGRELLELHTVGLGAGYHEHDVVDSARILTGWQVAMWTKHWDAGYNELAHYTRQGAGPRLPLPQPLGQRQARHPAVPALPGSPPRHGGAHRDQAGDGVRLRPPAAGLVNHLAHVYLANGTQIKPVLRALVDSPQFRHSVGQVIRDPENDLVATYRLMGVHVAKPHAADRTAHELVLAGQRHGAGADGLAGAQRPPDRRERRGARRPA